MQTRWMTSNFLEVINCNILNRAHIPDTTDNEELSAIQYGGEVERLSEEISERVRGKGELRE